MAKAGLAAVKKAMTLLPPAPGGGRWTVSTFKGDRAHSYAVTLKLPNGGAVTVAEGRASRVVAMLASPEAMSEYVAERVEYTQDECVRAAQDLHEAELERAEITKGSLALVGLWPATEVTS